MTRAIGARRSYRGARTPWRNVATVNLFRQMPTGPSEWELLLRELGVSEPAVLNVLEGSVPEAAEIRRWVRRHFEKRFVPPAVITLLGLDVALDRSVALGIQALHRRPARTAPAPALAAE